MRSSLTNLLLLWLIAAQFMAAQGVPVPIAPLGHPILQFRTFAISGTVEDQSGAVVPAAELVLLDQTTNQPRQAAADNFAHFVFKGVLRGTMFCAGRPRICRVRKRRLQSRNLVRTSTFGWK